MSATATSTPSITFKLFPRALRNASGVSGSGSASRSIPLPPLLLLQIVQRDNVDENDGSLSIGKTPQRLEVWRRGLQRPSRKSAMPRQTAHVHECRRSVFLVGEFYRTLSLDAPL